MRPLSKPETGLAEGEKGFENLELHNPDMSGLIWSLQMENRSGESLDDFCIPAVLTGARSER